MSDLCDCCGHPCEAHQKPIPVGLGTGRERRSKASVEIPVTVAPGRVVTVKVARACYQDWLVQGLPFVEAEALALGMKKSP